MQEAAGSFEMSVMFTTSNGHVLEQMNHHEAFKFRDGKYRKPELDVR
jgi:hypothetical protein